MALWSSEFYAQKSLDGKISALYGKHAWGGVSSEEREFLKNITEAELSASPDSVVYQYHFLRATKVGNPQERLYHAEKALRLLDTKSMYPFVVPQEEHVFINLAKAEILYINSEIDKAILQYERTLVRSEDFIGDKIPEVKSMCLRKLGVLHAVKGFKREAVDCLERAFEISSKDYVPGDSEASIPLRLLADYYEKIQEFEKSILQYRRLIRFFEEHYAQNTADCAEAYAQLGKVYLIAQDYDSAMISYKQAISISQQANAKAEVVVERYIGMWAVCAAAGNTSELKEMESILQEYFSSRNRKNEYYTRLLLASSLLPLDSIEPILNKLLGDFSKFDRLRQNAILEQLRDVVFDERDHKKVNCYCTAGIKLIESSVFKDIDPMFLCAFYARRSGVNKGLDKYESALGDAWCALQILHKCYDRSELIKMLQKRLTLSKPDLLLLPMLQDLYISMQNSDMAIEFGRITLAAVEFLAEKSSKEYMSCALKFYVSLIQNQEYDEAVKGLKSLSYIVLLFEGGKSKVYAEILQNLGEAYLLKGDKENAIAYLKEARDVQFDAEGTIDRNINQYLKDLGYE